MKANEKQNRANERSKNIILNFIYRPPNSDI